MIFVINQTIPPVLPYELCFTRSRAFNRFHSFTLAALTSSRLDRTVSHAATAAARSRELAEVLATRRDLRATQLGVSGPTANMSGSGGAGELGSLLV